MFFQRFGKQSNLFTEKEIKILWKIMNCEFKNSKYGIGSVVTYQNDKSYRKLIYSPSERKFLIPNYEEIIKNYYTCGQYARNSFKFFKEQIRQKKSKFVKSCAFVYGSNYNYAGHCIVALSKVRNLHLANLDQRYSKGCPSQINIYLNDHCLIFDPCEKQIIDYNKSSFKAQQFASEVHQIEVDSDNVFYSNDDETVDALGKVEGFIWGFSATSQGVPYIIFCSERKGLFRIDSHEDVKEQVKKFPKLFQSPEVQSTLSMFFNMQLVNSVKPFISSETLIY